MRLVYIFETHGPDDGRYLYRAPRLIARTLCRVWRHLDYALAWPERGE